jgi:hypothetical protein
VSITRRGRRLAKDRAVSLRPGRSRVLRMRLGRRTRRVLRRRGRRQVRVTVRTTSPWGTTRTVFRRPMVRRRR